MSEICHRDFEYEHQAHFHFSEFISPWCCTIMVNDLYKYTFVMYYATFDFGKVSCADSAKSIDSNYTAQ